MERGHGLIDYIRSQGLVAGWGRVLACSLSSKYWHKYHQNGPDKSDIPREVEFDSKSA